MVPHDCSRPRNSKTSSFSNNLVKHIKYQGSSSSSPKIVPFHLRHLQQATLQHCHNQWSHLCLLLKKTPNHLHCCTKFPCSICNPIKPIEHFTTWAKVVHNVHFKFCLRLKYTQISSFVWFKSKLYLIQCFNFQPQNVVCKRKRTWDRSYSLLPLLTMVRYLTHTPLQYPLWLLLSINYTYFLFSFLFYHCFSSYHYQHHHPKGMK